MFYKLRQTLKKYFTLYILTLLILINIYLPYNFEIGMIWKKLHVNSLIGFQKSIEQTTKYLNIGLDIWSYFIFPSLNISLLNIIILIWIVIFSVNIKKK